MTCEGVIQAIPPQVSVQAHHSFVDGIHVGRFIDIDFYVEGDQGLKDYSSSGLFLVLSGRYREKNSETVTISTFLKVPSDKRSLSPLTI